MKIVYIALAIIGITLFTIVFQHNALSIIHWINTLGPIAPLFFLLLYCLATLLLLPTMVLTLAGGALFGPILGTLFNLIGATFGATCAFCISRYFAYNWLYTKKNIHITQLMATVEGRGWQFVALLRLVPIVPFNIVNYGLGMTHIKFTHYLVTTAIFLIPAEIFFTYCGYAGMDALIHPKNIYKSGGLLFIVLICLILLIKFGLKHYPTAVTKNNTSCFDKR